MLNILKELSLEPYGEDLYQEALNYDNCEYNYFLNVLYSDYIDYFDVEEKLQQYIKALYELINNKEINYYNNYIELSKDYVWNKILDECEKEVDTDLLTNDKYNLIMDIASMYLDDLVNRFEYESGGVQLYIFGRGSRHICVDNTLKNIIKLDELIDLQQKYQKEYIKYVTNEIISLINSKKEN